MNPFEKRVRGIWICVVAVIAIAYAVGLSYAFVKAPHKFWVWPLTLVVMYFIDRFARRSAGMTSIEGLAATRYATFPPENARARAVLAIYITRIILPVIILAVLYFSIANGTF
jgi:hypothetical protein